MIFTDDDLKQLKECVATSIGLLYLARMTKPNTFDIEALLARLEACEAALQEYKSDAGETVLYAKWRDSCGR